MLKGLKVGSLEIISSHCMEKLLKRDHSRIIGQFHDIQAFEDTSHQVHPNLQLVLDKHQQVFEHPQGLPPSRGGHNYSIPLLHGSLPPNLCPYRHPFAQKNEIGKIVQEVLAARIIRPTTNPYPSPVVMVLEKEGTLSMCINFHTPNNLIVKDKFPILIFDNLLDKLHGAQFFTKLDLHSDYHQIRMKEADMRKTSLRTHHGRYEFLVMPFCLFNASSTF